MKRISFTIETISGDVSILAYPLGRGLFLHRPWDGCVKSKDKDWVISAKNGRGIIYVDYGKGFHDILRAVNVLRELDWSNAPTPNQPERWFKFVKEERSAYVRLVRKFKKALIGGGNNAQRKNRKLRRCRAKSQQYPCSL